MFANISIAEFDPELAQAIASEGDRQEAHIELIASENYCSKAVMEAQGSNLLTNMQKAIRANAIMAVVNMLTLLSNLQLTVRKSCLVQIMQTYNHMQAHKQTQQFT
jgi:hypothetical protein